VETKEHPGVRQNSGPRIECHPLEAVLGIAMVAAILVMTFLIGRLVLSFVVQALARLVV
jgi:hypothetical protein